MLNPTDVAADLGITATTQPAPSPVTTDGGYTPWPLVEDSATARALARVWAGQRVVVVKAPPGSGKTHSVVTLMSHLVPRAGLSVAVGCPTRAQAAALTQRLFEALPAGMVALEMSGKAEEPGLSEAAAKSTITGTAGVTVRTLSASKAFIAATDLFVVDEAYQATFADVADAARSAPQILLVGDPGQIGPVVGVDTSVWEPLRQAPHRRSPEVFEARDDAVSFNIDQTFRLGPVTTEAIAPLYSFPFVSVRPDRTVVDRAGSVVPEVANLALAATDSPDDFAMLTAVVDRAADLALMSHRDADGTTRAMTPSDVAIVISRNSQVGVVTAMLASRGLSDITVGTADKLQGGEWTAVVALDPCAGMDTANDYLTSLGRLCVMASRHGTHLTWCHTPGWEPLLEAADGIPSKDRGTSVTVRRVLTSTPTV